MDAQDGREMEFKEFPVWPSSCKRATDLRIGWRFDLRNGLWLLDTLRVERFLDEALRPRSFGESVKTYTFVCEMYPLHPSPELIEEQQVLAKLTRYHQGEKRFLSVGQLFWNDVRFLDADGQLAAYKSALMRSVDNLAMRKRRPKDFDLDSFRAFLVDCLATLDSKDCAVDLAQLDLSPPEWDEDGRILYKNLLPHDVLE
jgi:hypothetical protein